MWEDGRQGGGYKKKHLFTCRYLALDAYLLFYPEGTVLRRHVDLVDGRRHYRLNITIVKPPKGGRLWCRKRILWFPRMDIFRSDYVHGVTKVKGGYRLVLSIGWAPLK